MEMGDVFKKVLLAGVGAVATTVDAAQDMVDAFVKKGEITVEQGKVLNEELKRNAKEKIKEHVTVNIVKETMDVESLTKEEREILKRKLAAMEEEEAKKANEAEADETETEEAEDSSTANEAPTNEEVNNTEDEADE